MRLKVTAQPFLHEFVDPFELLFVSWAVPPLGAKTWKIGLVPFRIPPTPSAFPHQMTHPAKKRVQSE